MAFRYIIHKENRAYLSFLNKSQMTIPAVTDTFS